MDVAAVMMSKISQELEIEDFDDMVLIPEHFSAEVLDFASTYVPTLDILSQETDMIYYDGINTIYNSCLEEDTDDVNFDQDKYIADLESLVYSLYNQRNFMVTLIANLQRKELKTPSGMWSSHELTTKMVLFCLTGIDYSFSTSPHKLYTSEQYESLCEAYDYLPAEWQPKAALFIQEYASNYFRTELATCV